MPRKNPPHPGGLVRRPCIEPLGLTITAAAAALGVTRTTLSELVNGKRGISPQMAVRLSKVFRRQCRKLAHAAGAVQPCTGSRRSHQAQAAGTEREGRSTGSSRSARRSAGVSAVRCLAMEFQH